MWRYLVGAVAALLLVGGGVLLFNGRATPPAPLAAAIGGAAPAAQAGSDTPALPDSVPAASDQTREQRRFGRYDKDRDGQITREEYLNLRRRAYVRLDTNHDGQLSFDEWAARSITKFTTADHDHSGAMDAAEFATTAPVRRPRVQRQPCARAPAPADASVERDDDS